jgi:hypothetical protein
MSAAQLKFFCAARPAAPSFPSAISFSFPFGELPRLLPVPGFQRHSVFHAVHDEIVHPVPLSTLIDGHYFSAFLALPWCATKVLSRNDIIASAEF